MTRVIKFRAWNDVEKVMLPHVPIYAVKFGEHLDIEGTSVLKELKGEDIRVAMHDEYRMEVIGNIYENPELLK